MRRRLCPVKLATTRTLPLVTEDLGTLDDLVDLVSGGGVLVLSGAGMSTADVGFGIGADGAQINLHRILRRESPAPAH